MGLFSLFLLSMRSAYNNPFNQAANPSARRQRAINNKATHLLIFVFWWGGGGDGRVRGFFFYIYICIILLLIQKTQHENDFTHI